MSYAVDAEEISDLIDKIGGLQGSTQERIARAARRLNWEYGRTKRLRYREARRVESHEMEAARAEARRTEEAATNVEIAKLQVRLARLEALLGARADAER